jgi:predicted nucleic acid-binding protein
MKTYVLDASALVRYLSNGPGVAKVDALIDRAAKDQVRLLISAVNWGEALYSLARVMGLGEAKADLKTVSGFVESIEVGEALAEAAAGIRMNFRLGYADCFAAALAIDARATLVTADLDFAKLGRRLKILALPGPAS